MTVTLAKIDLSLPPETLSPLLLSALSTHGAFYLVGSPLLPIPTAQILSSARRFFDLPESSKFGSIHRYNGAFVRGYISPFAESGSQEFKERKEGFAFGYPSTGYKEDNLLTGPNHFPNSAPPSFEAHCNAFYDAVFELVQCLTCAIENACALETGSLRKLLEGDAKQIGLVRLFKYYKPQTAEEIGSSPHTDWGFLTLIAQQSQVTGLELQHEGKWHSIPPLDEPSLLVNAGDFLSILTKGKIKSPLHRVVVSEERISAVCFIYPRYDAEMPNAEGEQQYSLFEQQDGKAIERVGTFGDWIASKWASVSRSY